MKKTGFKDVLAARRSTRDFSNKAIDRDSLERLIWASQGKTDEVGRRTVPSAKSLYPLRLYVVVSRVEDLGCGVYSVNHDNGELEAIHDRDIRLELQDAAVDEQVWIGNASAIISICADFVAPCKDFADQQPFGQRGSRYVYIEAGACAQNIQLQATFEGLGSVLVAGFNDELTSIALNLEKPVAPVLHLCLGLPA